MLHRREEYSLVFNICNGVCIFFLIISDDHPFVFPASAGEGGKSAFMTRGKSSKGKLQLHAASNAVMMKTQKGMKFLFIFYPP